MVPKAKSTFLVHFPFACRGWANRFRFSYCPPVPQESRTFHSNQLLKKTIKKSESNNLSEVSVLLRKD
jgi:hypothetical protein